MLGGTWLKSKWVWLWQSSTPPCRWCGTRRGCRCCPARPSRAPRQTCSPRSEKVTPSLMRERWQGRGPRSPCGWWCRDSVASRPRTLSSCPGGAPAAGGGCARSPRTSLNNNNNKVVFRAANDPSVFTITERAFAWFKAGRLDSIDYRFLKPPVPYDNCVWIPISQLLTVGWRLFSIVS